MKILNTLTAIILFTLCFSTKTNAQTSATTKELNIINFTIYEKNAKLIFEWSTDGTVVTNTWEVQSSVDGKQFTAIAIVLGNDPTQPGDKYFYAEKLKSNKTSTLYYRLRHIDTNGNEQFSKVLQPTK
jgi:hypothetical protein